MSHLVALMLLEVACGRKALDTGAGSPDPGEAHADSDHDGFSVGSDCNDEDARIFPGADEICNLLDDDCDGLIDDDDDGLIAYSFYMDSDDDAYGSSKIEVSTCYTPDGYVREGGDCDDANPEVNPGEEDHVDGIDNDCNGLTDEARGFVGIMLLGVPDSSEDGWQCANVYDSWGQSYSYDYLCEGCDFSFMVDATLVEGAEVAYGLDSCDEDALGSELITDVNSLLFAFDYQPSSYDYPAAYFIYNSNPGWYMVSPLTYAPGPDGADSSYLSWSWNVNFAPEYLFSAIRCLFIGQTYFQEPYMDADPDPEARVGSP